MDVQQLYAQFCARQQQAIAQMIESASAVSPAMDCAIFSSAYRAGCEALLFGGLPEQGEAEEEQ